ncbi:MAG: hypothetical protein AAB431_03790 [Patescibacteria group bacterium]
MTIYIAHSRAFDYKKELYEPIKNASFGQKHTLILPHENSEEVSSSKEFFQKKCDLVIAEVSQPSTGMGIELGWADAFNVPIACLHKKGSPISKSLSTISTMIFEYTDTDDMITIIQKIIQNIAF